MVRERKLDLILIVFVVALVLSNLLGAKIVQFSLPSWISGVLNWIFFPLLWICNGLLVTFGGEPIDFNFFEVVHVSVGILLFPLTFLATDVVEEVVGKHAAHRLIKMGMVALCMVVLFTAIAVLLPPAQRSIDDNAFRLVFGSSIRLTVASFVAFAIAQTYDVWAFRFWRQMTGGKWLWLRNNLSTMVSQFVDSTLFMFIAFYQLTPKFTVPFLISMIIPWWIFKMIVAACDTPFCYLGVRWLSENKR